MIGIVAVSHSARLGEAARELAQQMVRGGGAPVRVAAGAGQEADGTPILGTDAVAVAAAIDDLAAECEGVLVLMDLGSAVLSAELALELRLSDVPVRLAPAPFVEGLLAAVVSASGGAALDVVAEEASGALVAKTGQLGDGDVSTAPGPAESSAASPDASTRPGATASAPGASAPDADAARVVRVRNRQGVHARPAALIAEAAAGHAVVLRRLPDGPEATATSLIRLLALGARQGDEVALHAPSPDAASAVDRIAALFADGFGEGTDDAPAADAALPAAAPPAADPGADAPGADDTPVSGDAASLPSDAVDSPLPAGSTLRGRGVSPGVAAAPVRRLAPPVPEPDASVVVAPADRPGEVAAIERAVTVVAEHLRVRGDASTGDAREILDATRTMVTDPELRSDAAALVAERGRSAARAVWDVLRGHEQALSAVGGRTAERVTDIRDVRDRIVSEILGRAMPGVPDGDDPFVLVAEDLSPADTASLAGGACVALVTEQGGPTSHTAIIARSLGLPAVVAVAGATRIAADTPVLVDGERGTVEVDPDPARVADARARSVRIDFAGEGCLRDGVRVPLLANVGGAADALAAAEALAEGVGLFRTEFCFLGRTDAPTIDEQVIAYRGVLSPFAGRRVVVRTLDAGSDKPLPFVHASPEENPALGVRGLRIARRAPAVLDDQLRALALAADAESARVEVMAPMVATLDEAEDFATRARAAGIARVGVMIETPAAALLARELLQVVDFVSVGTNDLAQYTLAADRLLGELADLNDPWQPAVLRLIGTVGAAGRALGRPVGVCGEAAADPQLAPVLVGLGVTSLSMGARSLGRVADALAGVDSETCARAARAASATSTAEAARASAREALGAR